MHKCPACSGFSVQWCLLRTRCWTRTASCPLKSRPGSQAAPFSATVIPGADSAYLETRNGSSNTGKQWEPLRVAPMHAWVRSETTIHSRMWCFGVVGLVEEATYRNAGRTPANRRGLFHLQMKRPTTSGRIRPPPVACASRIAQRSLLVPARRLSGSYVPVVVTPSCLFNPPLSRETRERLRERKGISCGSPWSLLPQSTTLHHPCRHGAVRKIVSLRVRAHTA